MNKKEPSKMLFTEAAVKSMQAEKIIYYLYLANVN